jgi:hypothetical protein
MNEIRLKQVPADLLDHLVIVFDTADTIRIGLEDLGIDSPELVLGLTRLVFERQDREAQKLSEIKSQLSEDEIVLNHEVDLY